MKLILGSQSKGRQLVLKDAGIEFTSIPANIDEKAIRSDDYTLLPLLLARAKADALAAKIQADEPALLLTADTVVIYKDELREKPQSPEQARAYLSSYEPTTPAWVTTGVVVTNLLTGKRVEGRDRGGVYFHSIPDAVIEQAIQEGYIFGCAGAFAIETPLLKPLIAKIDGEASAIIGLPLSLTQNLLQQARS